MRIRWGDKLSRSFRVSNGVRQGGVISPLLFNVYTDELSNLLCASGVGCIMGIRINHIMYADDLCLLATSVAALQLLFNIVLDYGSDHDIVVNEKKTECVYCIVTKSGLAAADVKFPSGVPLRRVDKFKYLGCIISSDSTDNDDIARQTRLLYGRGNLLARKFKSCSTNVKRVLFNAYCGNIYCFALFSEFRKSVFDKLRVSYNNCVRILFGFPWRCSASEMCVQLRLSQFHHRRRVALFSVHQRVLQSKNMLLVALRGCEAILRDSLFRQSFLSVSV
jgi:hypothetical protein